MKTLGNALGVIALLALAVIVVGPFVIGGLLVAQTMPPQDAPVPTLKDTTVVLADWQAQMQSQLESVQTQLERIEDQQAQLLEAKERGEKLAWQLASNINLLKVLVPDADGKVKIKVPVRGGGGQ